MRTLALFVIGLVFGGGIGFVTAAGMGVTFDGHDHGNPAHHGAGQRDGHALNHNIPIDVSPADAPTLAIDVTPDPKAGYNLHVMVENFAFSPEHASLDHIPGQGHAHVYVNGVKRGRVYGPWVHLDSMPKGTVIVEVSLNANTHQPLAMNGTPITATTLLEIEE